MCKSACEVDATRQSGATYHPTSGWKKIAPYVSTSFVCKASNLKLYSLCHSPFSFIRQQKDILIFDQALQNEKFTPCSILQTGCLFQMQTGETAERVLERQSTERGGKASGDEIVLVLLLFVLITVLVICVCVEYSCSFRGTCHHNNSHHHHLSIHSRAEFPRNGCHVSLRHHQGAQTKMWMKKTAWLASKPFFKHKTVSIKGKRPLKKVCGCK